MEYNPIFFFFLYFIFDVFICSRVSSYTKESLKGHDMLVVYTLSLFCA